MERVPSWIKYHTTLSPSMMVMEYIQQNLPSTLVVWQKIMTTMNWYKHHGGWKAAIIQCWGQTQHPNVWWHLQYKEVGCMAQPTYNLFYHDIVVKIRWGHTAKVDESCLGMVEWLLENYGREDLTWSHFKQLIHWGFYVPYGVHRRSVEELEPPSTKIRIIGARLRH